MKHFTEFVRRDAFEFFKGLNIVAGGGKSAGHCNICDTLIAVGQNLDGMVNPHKVYIIVKGCVRILMKHV